MSQQKRFSKLAIAAGILLTASATGFAQTDSNKSQTESADSGVIAINRAPKLELRWTSSKVTTTAVKDVKATESRTTLSASSFTESTGDSFLKPSVTSAWGFRTELSNTPELTDQSKSNRVEFVPSRSPRLPW